MVLVLLIMDFNNRTAELHRLSQQEEVVAVKATAQMQTQVHLETQIAYATSDEAVAEWARVQARMALEGERPVVPLTPTESVVVATPQPVEVSGSVSNLDIWLALFFDVVP